MRADRWIGEKNPMNANISAAESANQFARLTKRTDAIW